VTLICDACRFPDFERRSLDQISRLASLAVCASFPRLHQSLAKAEGFNSTLDCVVELSAIPPYSHHSQDTFVLHIQTPRTRDSIAESEDSDMNALTSVTTGNQSKSEACRCSPASDSFSTVCCSPMLFMVQYSADKIRTRSAISWSLVQAPVHSSLSISGSQWCSAVNVNPQSCRIHLVVV
jgi:hypothetical protein